MYNPEDKITLDVPLFIRLLEYAREDAKTDMDLHNVTDNIIKMSLSGDTLTMDDYDAIVKIGQTPYKEPTEEEQQLGRLRSLAGI
jgi:hypothetical protein